MTWLRTPAGRSGFPGRARASREISSTAVVPGARMPGDPPRPNSRRGVTAMARPTLVLALLTCVASQAPAPAPDPVSPDPNAPRPIPARDTVFMEDMTWMEVRDALRAGKDTAIVATGGIEQNGPYLVAGKHNLVLRVTTEVIARKLGDALVAPIVPFVPEGDIDPPTEHIKYPGTISLTEDTYRLLLTDICACFKTHGFAHIVMIGDSGGHQTGMKHV